MMYYLDLHKLYKSTNPISRSAIRTELDRNAMMEKKLKHQHGKCFYCGVSIDMTGHLDHLMPVYYGGTNKSVNLVAACKSCNLTKMVDQIEITNEYTIKDYENMQSAKKEYDAKLKEAIKNNQARKVATLKRYQPKKVMLYGLMRADLFRTLK